MTTPYHLPRTGMQELLQRLQQQGFEVIAPTVAEGAIVYRPSTGAASLPWGVSEVQQPGRYTLQEGPPGRAFAWANGPQALKPLFFSPRESLWRSSRQQGALRFDARLPAPAPLAIIGVRSCDLAALALHDAHFLGGVEADPHYGARRRDAFLVAVNCSHPASTCFCASSGDGPSAESGYDLLLDELDEGFLVTAGTPRGEALLATLALAEAGEGVREQALAQRQAAARAQQRTLPGRQLQQPLFERLDHARWQQLGERCLACGNCTAVCPTCFCHSEHDEPMLDGGQSEHLRQWDSCFSQGHSYIHGIVIRAERAQRYRQWLSHKFGSWHEQYGRSGCVGCGRCISWCPVGIDVTEELHAICGEES